MWLWWAIPAAYLAVAALTQPRIAMDRYKSIRAQSSASPQKAKQMATEGAFGRSLVWPVTMLMMRSSRTIQAALDDEQQRADARKQIADHNREQAQREADDFERQLNGVDGLPKHVKARSLNLDFIGAHVAGTGSYGHAFSGKLDYITLGRKNDPLTLRVGGEYKYPEPDSILTINGGRA